MKTIEEREDNFAKKEIPENLGTALWRDGYREGLKVGYHFGATEQKAIDKELIDMLIEELQTSRLYLLGITGLDSAAERARKERNGDSALVRGIDSVIKYVRESMEES